MHPLIVSESPFLNPPQTNAPATWVRPELVCEVRFTEWTNDKLMRHPSFLGLREDISAAEVRREVPVRHPRLPKPVPTARTGLTNPEKIFWPESGYTKADLFNYYSRIAPFILPYLKDRIQTLNRYPNGINGESFYQKNVSVSDWITTFRIRSESEDRAVNYLVCQNKDTLLYLANLGCIELHVSSARIRNPRNPDHIVIDLDPLEIPFTEVVKTALTVHKILQSVGVESFCKTSGATGHSVSASIRPRH